MVIVDTNVIIDFLRQNPTRAQKSLLERLLEQRPHQEIAISLITVQELYVGKSTKKKEEVAKVLDLLDGFAHLEYTYEIAKRAGEIERDCGVTADFADIAIAATAIAHDIPLLTLNTKHFAHIPNLNLMYIEPT